MNEMSTQQNKRSTLEPRSFEEYYNYVYQNFDYDSIITSTSLSIDYININYDMGALPLAAAKQLPLKFYQHRFSSQNICKCELRVGLCRCQCQLRFRYEGNLYIGTSITIWHPNKECLQELEKISGPGYTITRIEYTVDLYSDDPGTLFRLLKLTSYLSWAGKSFSSSYLSTIYLNDNRKSSSKSAKLYLKEIDSRVAIRLEMILKHRHFAKGNVKTIAAAIALPAEQVFKYWRFQSFNNRRFLRSIINERRNVLNRDELRLLGHEIERSFFSRVYSTEDGGGVRVMRKIIKEFNLEPSRFMEEHQFQAFFFDLIKGKRFI